eukprot:g6193.t1
MTSLAELEKKLALITGEDIIYNDVDEVKKSNSDNDSGKNNNIKQQLNNMSIKSINDIKNKSQQQSDGDNNAPSSSYLSPAPSTSKTTRVYDKSYTEKMYSRGMETKEKLKKRRESIPEGCTFKPTISRRSKRLGSVSGKASKKQGSAFERLYKTAETTKHSIQKLREDELLEQCTFQPKINKNSNKYETKSVNNGSTKTGRVSRFDRLYQNAAQSRAKLEKKKKDHDSKILTFKPKITSRGSRSRSPGGKKRYEMLYNDGRKERIQRRKQERDEKEISECTFQPKINRKRSSSARRARSGDDAPKDVYAHKAELESLGLIRISDDYGEGNDTDTKKERLSPKNAHKLTKEEINRSVNRLSNEYIKKRDEKLKKREIELKKEEGLTFRPSIKPYRRPQSARRSRPNEEPQSKIWDRLHIRSQDAAKRHERLKKAKVAKEIEECTFKPNIGKRSSSIVAKRRGRSPSPSPNTSSRNLNDKRHNSNTMLNEFVKTGNVYTLQNNLPTKNNNGSINSNNSNGRDVIPIWERLSYDKRDILNERAQLKLQKELDECKPKKTSPKSTNRYRSGTRRKPIWERLNEQRKDVEALDAMREYTELQACTFQPKTNSGKKRSPDRKAIWERLHERKNKKELIQERLQIKERVENEKFIAKAKGKVVSRDQADSIFNRLHKKTLGGIRGMQDSPR